MKWQLVRIGLAVFATIVAIPAALSGSPNAVTWVLAAACWWSTVLVARYIEKSDRPVALSPKPDRSTTGTGAPGDPSGRSVQSAPIGQPSVANDRCDPAPCTRVHLPYGIGCECPGFWSGVLPPPCPVHNPSPPTYVSTNANGGDNGRLNMALYDAIDPREPIV